MYKIHVWNLGFGNISLMNLKLKGYYSHGKILSEEQSYPIGTNLVGITWLWWVDMGFQTLTEQPRTHVADRAFLLAGDAPVMENVLK